jgi:hypothetical protein
VPSPRNARRTGPQAKDIAAQAISAALVLAGETVLEVRKNGSGISTLTFAAARTAPMFALHSAIGFVAGDDLCIVNEDPGDATLAGVLLTFAGTRGN